MKDENMQTHGPDECTYVDPNNVEVLAFRDERHVVLPSDEYRTLIGLAAKQNDLNERLNAENERLAEDVKWWRERAIKRDPLLELVEVSEDAGLYDTD